MRLANNKEESMEQFMVTGIALNENEAKITVKGVPDKPGIAGFLFTKLAKANINVDMIIQSGGREGKNDISFTVDKNDLKEVKKIMEEIKSDLKAEKITYDPNMAKVSIVGAGMQSHPGVAARMFTCLGKVGINIDLISTSEIKISCAVKKEEGARAVKLIHQEFELNKE